MLDRPPSPPPDRAARHRARSRAYRRRQRQGCVMVSVPVDGRLIDLLIRTRHLSADKVHSRAEIAAAVAAMLASAADE